jgi:acetyl-CoA acetyltransferase
MERTLKDQAVIVGIGQTEFSKNSGRSELQLAAECVRDAILDAGLEPAQIDGFSTFTLDSTDEIEVARAVGCGDFTFYSQVNYGGGAALGIVHHAAMAVATGSAKYAVGYRALNGRSGQRYSEGVSGDIITSDAIHWGYYMPFGFLTPASWVAMFTQRYMHDYGCKSTDLAEVCIQQRKHAVNNPNAFFYGKELTLEDHQNSKIIAHPFHLFDCCQESDGGCAFVVTTPERAKDLKQPGAIIHGIAMASGDDQEQMTSFYRPDITRLPEYELVGKQMWEMSGLSPDDVEAAIIYDAFSSIVLFQLEALGFCGIGEAKDFVKDGALELGGRLPSNTHGGQLSEAYIHGINGVNEGVRLIRGTSVNQPEKNDCILVTGGVGVPTSAMVLGKL